MLKFVLTLSMLVLPGVLFAVEPPVIRDAEPPMLRECQCGVTCECPVCDGNCTVPVLADIPYNASHSCPRCGTFANIVERELAGGVHTHRCGSCNTEWWHNDPGVQYIAAPVNPFASPCANGNCPPSIRSSGTTSVRSSNVTVTRSGVRTGPIRRIFGRFFQLRGGRCCG